MQIEKTLLEPILPELITIPGGCVWLGSDAPEARANERPGGCLTLPAFAIARTPVTQAEFARFIAAGRAPPRRGWTNGQPPAGQERHPAINVTWKEAHAYCDWLAASSGQPYRLPSEAEWERAARAGTQRRWPWGDTFDPALANTREAGRSGTMPVDAHPGGASQWGILDMAGNAWEWTSDVYRPYSYRSLPPLDSPPLPPGLNESRRRVLRGGSCMAEATWARCSSRVSWRPFYIFSGCVGFRVACGLA